MPKKKGKRPESTPEEPMTAREMELLRNRRHVHIHELHGAEQVRQLRRPHREALGYR
jgi:hypothetical protein